MYFYLHLSMEHEAHYHDDTKANCREITHEPLGNKSF